MANIHDDPAALKALQDDIYREKILRSRTMTPEQRLAEVFELSNREFDLMLAEAMAALETTDPKKGWEEVRRQMDVCYQERDRGFFVTEKPGNA